MAAGEHPIDFWGGVACNEDLQTLVGRNALGRLLMELREREPIGPALKTDAPVRHTRQPSFTSFEAHI
jgi:hypothetical protein